MQITRQADYALRAMLYLARLGPNERAATKKIAEVQKIPPSFLAKIISQLSVAGLIKTTRGAHGGVVLSRSTKEISLLDVVEAIDGPIALNECTVESGSCDMGGNCPLHDVWSETQIQLVERLRKTTFDRYIAKQSGA